MSDGSSLVAPSETQTRTMSRIDRMPARLPPSTTTRWRKPPRTIASAARSSDQSGEANTRSAERWSATSSVSGSCPRAIDWSMSRSVMMPGPGCSGSITTAAPTPRSAIAADTSRRDLPGETVSTVSLIPARTCMQVPSS